MDNKRDVIAVGQALLATKRREIDFDREFSHGKGGAKTFIDERRGGHDVSWTIANNLLVSKNVVIGLSQNTQFADDAELIAAVGADLILDDGVLLTVGDDTITGTSNDADRTIAQHLRYFNRAATRITRVSFQSQKEDGTADTTNFNNSLKTIWVSPFAKPLDNFLQLRKFQNASANSPQYADVDFVAEGFDVIFSNEHFMVVKVNAGTTLNITMNVGMQDSRAQRFYRAVKTADKTLAPFSI